MDIAFCDPQCVGELADPGAVAHKYRAPFEPLLAKCKSVKAPSLADAAPNGLLRLAILTPAVAVVPITGMLMPYDQVGIRAALIHAMNESRIEEVLILCNSPGGLALGVEETAQVLRAVSGHMKTTVIVQGYCASAAYYVCSQAQTIIATPSSWVGSVGTIIPLVDYSKMYEDAGLRVMPVTSAPAKAVGLPGKAVTAEDVESVQQMVNALQRQFLLTLDKSPRLTAEQLIAAANAEIYLAENAQKRGLIDRVELLELAVLGIELQYQHLKNKTYGAAAVTEAMTVLGLKYRHHLDAAALGDLGKQRPALANEVRKHLAEEASNRASYAKIFGI